MSIALMTLLACIKPLPPGPSPAQAREQLHATIEMPIQGSQVIYLQATIRAGSAADPVGQEGVAYLTARMLREGGAGERSPEQVELELQALAAEIQVIVDKDLVTIRGKALAQDAERFVPLFTDMVTAPSWDPATFERLRSQSVETLSTSLLADTEGLGDAVLDSWLNQGHPYGHHVQGRTGALEVLSLAQAQAYYESAYVREAVSVGLAGELSQAQGYVAAFDALPVGRMLEPVPRSQPAISGRQLLVVQSQTAATGVHMGHPMPVDRSHPDWPALLLGLSAFGEHRQSWGVLFETMRTQRGLNYGDYAYVEHYRQVGWSDVQELGTARIQPQFSMWLRPLEPDNAAFALKLALHLSEQLLSEGLDPKHFERMQASLVKRTSTLARDPGRRLGFALDAAALDQPDRLDLAPALAALTLEQVNVALAAHIHPQDLKIVIVAQDAQGILNTLTEESPTPIVYADVTPDSEQAALDSVLAASSAKIGTSSVIPAQDIFR